MLSKISDFFQSITGPDLQTQHPEVSLEVACAVLLCEVMRSDGKFSPSEQAQIKEAMQSQFSLTETEIDEIILHALEHSEHATDFFQFTSKINSHYVIEERIQIVKLLWQIALADGEISSIEEHTIRRISDLLHLRHGEYISTKPLK